LSTACCRHWTGSTQSDVTDNKAGQGQHGGGIFNPPGNTVTLNQSTVAEIRQHAVAHVLRYEAIELGDGIRHTFVIGSDHRTQIFGIELCGERRRAHKVCEHDGELAPLGVVPWLRLGWGCGLRRDGCGAGKLGNCHQHLAPMPK
jgi:hypothetical protein